MQDGPVMTWLKAYAKIRPASRKEEEEGRRGREDENAKVS